MTAFADLYRSPNRAVLKMKKTPWIALALAVFVSPSHAKDVRDQLNIQTGRAVLVIPGVAPQQVAEKVKDAVTQFAIPASLNFKPMPSPLPARPGSAVAKEVIVQGSPATEFVCEGAYAEITKMPPAVENALYFNREAMRSCLYAFEGGVKVDMIFHVIRRTESLTSGLFNGITKSIRGSDGERITAQLKENIEEIRKKLPGVLVASIEAPGLAPVEPDQAAVAKLIAPVVPGDAPVQDKPAVVARAEARRAVAAPAAAPAGGIDLSLVGARKELNAMGFKFHDQDQFVDAARRNDFLTVRLFLAAAGIKPGAPDSKGETALSFAKDNTEMKMFLTMFAEAEKQGAYPGNISEAVFAK